LGRILYSATSFSLLLGSVRRREEIQEAREALRVYEPRRFTPPDALLGPCLTLGPSIPFAHFYLLLAIPVALLGSWGKEEGRLFNGS
jgi:hypothetical protein